MKKLFLLTLLTLVTFSCFSQQKNNHPKKYTIEFDSTLVKEVNGWIIKNGRPIGSNQNSDFKVTFASDSLNVEEMRNWILKYVKPTNSKQPTITVPNCVKCYKRHLKHHTKSIQVHSDQ